MDSFEFSMGLGESFVKMIEAAKKVKSLMQQQSLLKQNQLKQKMEVQTQTKEEEILLMVKCLKCQGYGHNKFSCPTKTFITNHDIREINEGESKQRITKEEFLVKNFDTIFTSSPNCLDISFEVKESGDDDDDLQTTGLSYCYDVITHCSTQIQGRILPKKVRVKYNGMVYNGMLQRSHYMVYPIILV